MFLCTLEIRRPFLVCVHRCIFWGTIRSRRRRRSFSLKYRGACPARPPATAYAELTFLCLYIHWPVDHQTNGQSLSRYKHAAALVQHCFPSIILSTTTNRIERAHCRSRFQANLGWGPDQTRLCIHETSRYEYTQKNRW